MSQIVPALRFLKEIDHENAKKQWREGKQFMSLLQRSKKSLEELLQLFDPSLDESDWSQEYGDKKRTYKLRLYRKRMAILKASRKEFHEEYDENVTDVDFMRLMEIPFTDSKYEIEFTIDELA